jgi:hypothetical protein
MGNTTNEKKNDNIKIVTKNYNIKYDSKKGHKKILKVVTRKIIIKTDNVKNYNNVTQNLL